MTKWELGLGRYQKQPSRSCYLGRSGKNSRNAGRRSERSSAQAGGCGTRNAVSVPYPAMSRSGNSSQRLLLQVP